MLVCFDMGHLKSLIISHKVHTNFDSFLIHAQPTHKMKLGY